MHTCWQVDNSNCSIGLIHVLSTFAACTASFNTQVFRVKYYVNLKIIIFMFTIMHLYITINSLLFNKVASIMTYKIVFLHF